MMKRLFLWLPLLLAFPLAAAETVLMRSQFSKNAEGWNSPSYWNGTLQWTPGSLVLKPEQKRGAHYGRCTKMLYPQRNLTGKIMTLRFTASGKGEVKIGGMIIPDRPGTPHMVWFGKAALKAAPAVVEQKIDLSLIQTYRISLILEVGAESEMKFSNVELRQKNDSRIRITLPADPVVRERISVLRAAVSAPAEKYAVVSGKSGAMLSAEKNGTLAIDGKYLPPEEDGSAKYTVSCCGDTAASAVTVVPAPEFDRNLELARKVSSKPLSLAWFGDSELDFDRANNTTAMVRYYLDRSGSGTAPLHNFAVAGDTITRAEARLSGRYAYRPEAFAQVRKVRADLVFVMLGHNDTVCWSNEKYSKPQTSPLLQRNAGRRLLRMIREIYPEARLILISPLALDNVFLRRRAEQEAAKGSPKAPCFGDPALMQEFCRNWMALAGEFQAEYVDLYTPMSKIPDRLRFFKTGDEVHLNARGHRWVTARLLEYLAAHPQKTAAARKLSASLPFAFRFSELRDQTLLRNGSAVSIDGQYTANGNGSVTLSPTAFAAVAGLRPDPAKGFSLEFVGRPQAAANTLNAFFCCGKKMLVGYDKRSIYMLFQGQKLHQAKTPLLFPEKSEHFHHVLLCCRYHEAPDQGEIWTEIRIFLNGRQAYEHKFKGLKFQWEPCTLEVGSALPFGRIWQFKGELLGFGFFPRVLTEKEVRERVQMFPEVQPAFAAAKKLTAAEEQLLRAPNLPPAFRAAVKNLALSGCPDWKKIVAAPEKHLQRFGDELQLVLLTIPGRARVVSVWDTKAGRDLLSWNNPFLRITLTENRRDIFLPLPEWNNTLAAPPVTRNGVTAFTLKHTHPRFPGLLGETRWQWNGKRLEYSFDFRSEGKGGVLTRIGCPSLAIVPLVRSGMKLFVPEAGGLLHENAERKKISFAGVYPRMRCSMQPGAVYDALGGVYFSPADPRARTKYYSIQTDSTGTEVNVDWPVPRDFNTRKSGYASGSSAAVEFFRGDWYDAGMLYRSELERTGAIWWRKTLPNTDTPEWFRNNTLHILMYHQADPALMIRLREYLELPFWVQNWYWWERGVVHHLCPILRANAEYITCASVLRRHGIRTISYVNGRLWATVDRRGESWKYPADGLNGAVIRADGKPELEPYGLHCAVLCPASKVYQQEMYRMVTRLTAQGIDGCYLDQLGAAGPVLCHSPRHLHRLNDCESWNVNGQWKTFMAVREFWRKNGVDAIMATEDNAEHCVRVMDGMMPWRWMHDHQVPFYTLVYAGRTQCTSRDSAGEEEAAVFPKAATQLIQGEQFGHYGLIQLTSPSRGVFRRYLKRLMHLRTACLDFFNEGLMERPPRFAEAVQKITTRWGNHGTGRVSTFPVVAGAWRHGENRIILLVNTTGVVQRNRIAEEPQGRQLILKSEGKGEDSAAFALEPYGCELRVYGPALPKKLAEHLQREFTVIRRTRTEKDPFGIQNLQFPRQENGDARQEQLVDQALCTAGGRLNRTLRVLDNVYYGMVYAGIMDFGPAQRGSFELSLSAPSYSGGGNIEIVLDHPDQGKIAAKLLLDRQKILTASWGDYRKFRCQANTAIGGKHAVYLKLNGGSVCNFRSWRWIPEK